MHPRPRVDRIWKIKHHHNGNAFDRFWSCILFACQRAFIFVCVLWPLFEMDLANTCPCVLLLPPRSISNFPNCQRHDSCFGVWVCLGLVGREIWGVKVQYDLCNDAEVSYLLIWVFMLRFYVMSAQPTIYIYIYIHFQGLEGYGQVKNLDYHHPLYQALLQCQNISTDRQ